MSIFSDKYDSILRKVVNEINVGGQQIDNESDEDSDNFMDDDGGGDDTQEQQADTTTDDGSDDDVGAGESDNFMDDDGGGGDDTTTADTDDSSDDVGADESDNFMDDDGGGDDDTTADDSDDVGAGESDDFMSDDDGGGDDTSSDGEGDGEETSDDESSEEGDGEDDYDLDKIEDELFSSLTPEQIAIKNHELKNQFIEIYSIIGSTLVRINDISKSNDNINILKFVTEKLLELREMIDYNITVAYSTRTYIENNIIYQQCIATLNAIADIIDNIPNVNGGETAEEKEENDEDDKGEPVELDDEQEQKSLNISDSSMSDYQEESTDYNSLF